MLSNRAAILRHRPSDRRRPLDHVAEMDAHAKLDPLFVRHAGVALDHAALHFNRAAHGVDHAAELADEAIAGALDDAPMMSGDGGVDEIAAQAPKTRERPILVAAPASRL
jgi:hypothetical protein